MLQNPTRKEAPSDWESWLKTLYPNYASAAFSDHHSDFWDWLWEVEKGLSYDPFIALWPRAGAKSTSVELGCVALGARKRRKFVLYVSETQDQANDHVANIAAMIEGAVVEDYYPKLAEKAVGKYGNQKGWRMSRLRCANGFSVVALGLDAAARGVKLEEDRPDLIVFDDIDAENDTPKTTQKKIGLITKKILPAGSDDCVVIFVQNLIHEDSIASCLSDDRAEFLANRIISGPIPAIYDLEYETDSSNRTVITGGVPSWEGQSIEICQEYIDRFGISAFLSECQHDVSDPPGGIFSHLEFERCGPEEVPDLVRVAVWVDPAVTSTDKSDAMGIQADGLGVDGKIYRLYSWEQITSPLDAIQRAIRQAVALGADSVGVETDQGGDTWEEVFKRALEAEQKRIREEAERIAEELSLQTGQTVKPKIQFFWPSYKSAKAGSGHGPKTHRAQQQLSDYERGLIVHVRGTHRALEKALYRFPEKKPYDLVDASYWSWYDLRNGFAGKAGGHMHF